MWAGPGKGREAMQVAGAGPWVRTGLAKLFDPAESIFPDPTGQKLAQGLDGDKDFLRQLGKEGLFC